MACPPRRPKSSDPCETTFIVDLPILGEEEVSLPIDQMTQDILNSAIYHLPQYLPIAMEQARPFIDQVKSNALRDADLFVQRQMENRIRPEIESQSAVILSEIDRTANAALLTAALIGVSVVGGVGLVAWYYKGRR